MSWTSSRFTAVIQKFYSTLLQLSLLFLSLSPTIGETYKLDLYVQLY